MIMGETSAVSGIPRRRVPISLEPAIPTKLTVEGLKSQLTAIGLTCPAADEKRLVDYIADVKAALPSGAIQTYSILRPTATTAATAVQGLATGLGAMSDGNWQPDATGLGYMTELGYIQHGDHFKWLKDNLPGFSGTIDEPPVYHGTYDTIDAVKSMFATVGTVASSTLVKDRVRAEPRDRSAQRCQRQGLQPRPRQLRDLPRRQLQLVDAGGGRVRRAERRVGAEDQRLQGEEEEPAARDDADGQDARGALRQPR
jgi:hypothetical protein